MERAARGPTAQYLRNASGDWVTVDRDGHRVVMDPGMFAYVLLAAGLPWAWARHSNIVMVNLPQQYRAASA